MARKLVSFRLADDLQQALKDQSHHEGISTTELVNRLLRQGLALMQSPNQASGDCSSDIDERLKVVEEAVREIIYKQGLASNVVTPSVRSTLASCKESPVPLQAKIYEMEKRLQQISAGVEESRSSLRQLTQFRHAMQSDRDTGDGDTSDGDITIGSGQDAIPDQPNQATTTGLQETVTVSLEDLRQLIKSGV